MLFMELTNMEDVKIMVNMSLAKTIYPRTDMGKTMATIYFFNGDVIKVKETYAEIKAMLTFDIHQLPSEQEEEFSLLI